MSDVSEVLLDKLGERVAFERTGAQLYQALVNKYQDSEDKKYLPELVALERFYQQEAKHYELVEQVMHHLGGELEIFPPANDPTSSLTMGWMMLITDPSTNFLQALEIVLQAELVNHAGWELLIELAEKRDLPKVATQFQKCLDEKEIHIARVKQWVQDLTLNQAVQEAESKLSFVMEGNPEIKH